MFVIKFFVYFFVSFVILSMPVGKKTVFDFAYKYTKPVTSEITGYIYDKFDIGYSYSKDIIKEYLPETKDTVKAEYSAIKKRRSRKVVKKKKPVNTEMGSYTSEEKQMLERILNSASSD